MKNLQYLVNEVFQVKNGYFPEFMKEFFGFQENVT